MTVTQWPIEMLDVGLLDGMDEVNPNEMSDDEFSLLVEEIQESGWMVPVQVTGPRDGRYRLFGGHHRIKAAKVLGLEQVSATVIDPDTFDEDWEKVQLVKQNVLHGNLNPAKFTELFNDLAKTYDAGVLQTMMAFTKTDAFERVYLDAKKSLSPEMQERLEAMKDELKTVDDLSLVLNKLFTEYGSTVPYNFMFLSFGGREHLMVQMKQPGAWNRWKQFARWCQEEKIPFDEALSARMTWPM